MEQLKGGQEPLMMSGPKFGQDEGPWRRFSKNRSNIVLAIIAILIIAGGIYLYSNFQKANPLASISQSQSQQDQGGAVKPEQISLSDQTTNVDQQSATLTQKAEVVKTESSKITLKAGKGAGITHLARAAVKDYSSTSSDSKELKMTPEQKIYAEDYITKHTGNYRLKVGQELTFDRILIKEAIDHALQLNGNQLQNLHKYVLLVPSLSA